MEAPKDLKDCVFLTLDLDLTGNKLYDEMTNIGVHGPKVSFKQYVIPFRNVTLSARKKYLLKTTSMVSGKHFRVLRDMNTGKNVKTKTEIFALNDLLDFLEKQNENDNGICLMCFEPSKLVPFILIEALRRYNLLDRFKKVVKGFVDCFGFVKEKCASSIPKFSLRTYVKVLLNRDADKIHDAHERATLVYDIVTHLSEGVSQNKSLDLALGVVPFVTSVGDVEVELNEMKEYLQKQKTFTPIFQDQFRVSNLRVRATQLRKLLTSTNIQYESLKTSFQANDDMKEILTANLEEGTPAKDIADLANIITAHFQKLLTEKPKSQKSLKVKTPKQAAAPAAAVCDQDPVPIPQPQAQ